MKNKRTILTILFFLFIHFSYAQNISVKSFKVLPNDMDARVNYPVTDQNGEKCALIKVVTPTQGMIFEAGMLGIQKREWKNGEYWVYVPRGSKRITIKHEQLGVLRDYLYEEAIKDATSYEMVLTTATVRTIIEEEKITSAYLIINSEPEGADVYIDDKYRGQTPFSGKYKSGEHTYRLTKPKYHPTAGKVEISTDEGRKELDLSLRPNYGSLSVKSRPESGLDIFIDGKATGKTTPATITGVESGEHTVTLKSKWYQPRSKKVAVSDEETTYLDMSLEAVYGTVSVKTRPASDIYIDGKKVGFGSYEGKLVEGVHTFSAKKERYESDNSEKEIIAGKVANIQLNLSPRYGSLDVASSPMNASIYLNGKDYGETPQIINDLLVGEYTLVLKRAGYEDKEKTLFIKENQTSQVNMTMTNTVSVYISSNPTGAKIYVNGNYEGYAPQYIEMPIGKATVNLEKSKFRSTRETINVKQDQTRFNIQMNPDTKYYTTKGSALLQSTLFPGLGGIKTSQYEVPTAISFFIAGVDIWYVLYSFSNPDHLPISLGIYGAGALLDYINILASPNKSKQEVFSSTSRIQPNLKFQPNPITGKGDLMLSLTIDLD